MLKKNLFHKKFTKLVISITKGIESFFNLFRDKNFYKKIYLDPKKSTLDKKIFIPLAIIFMAIIVYFVLPSFYDKDKIKSQIENQVLQQYNFRVILNESLKYGLFPKPHFVSENTRIEYGSNVIANSKNTKFFISKSNFFLFNKIKIQNLIFTKTDFEIDHSNFKFFFNLFNNDTSNQNIDFIKSKFFYLDQYDEIIFLAEIKKLNYLFFENLLNEVKTKLNIFNLPVNIEVKHNFLEKKFLTEFKINLLKLKIIKILNYNGQEFDGQINLRLINNDKDIIYKYKNNNLTFNTNDNILSGEMNIKPFFLSSNLNIRSIKVSKLFKDNSVLVNLIKSEIFNNNNFNGKISVKANNLDDLKHVDEIKFDIQFEEGIILITNLNFVFKNSVIVNLEDVNLVTDNDNIKFIGYVNLDFTNTDNFYSHFQIGKKYRKKINLINSNFIFDLDSRFIEFNELKINGKSNQILEQFLNKFNFVKNDVFNNVVFKNTVKEFFKKINQE